MPPVRMPVTVAVMMPATAQEPRTCDVHNQAKAGNRDRLGEMDRDGCKDTADGFVADQQCNHRENERTAEPGEITKLAGAKREALIIGVLAGVSVSERREQKSACMRTHMQTVGDECD